MNKKEKKKMVISVIVVVAIVLVSIVGLFATGIIKPLTTEEIIIDTTGASSYAGKYLIANGNGFSQKFVVPDSVIKITQIGVEGFALIDPSWNNIYGWMGLSTTQTMNENSWAVKQEVHCSTPQTVPTLAVMNYDVQAGQTYYIMFKFLRPTSQGIWLLTRTGTYSGGDFGYYDSSWSQKPSEDALFTVQAVLNYGVDFSVLSAGAYPSQVTVGQSSDFIATITSPTGGTCNVILYKNYNTKEVWDTQAQTFAVNEQKTITFTEDNIAPAGTYPMAIECNVGGSEEAHRAFTFTVTESPNHAPIVPILTGDNSLTIGQTGAWQGMSMDSDGDTIKYIWTVDGSPARTSGFVSSGTSDSYSRSFSSEGTHIIAVKAQDSKGLASGWSTKTVHVSSEQEGDGGENPPSGFTVEVSVVDSGTYSAIEGAQVVLGSFTDTTNSQGIATFYSIPGGTYTIRASMAGYETGSISAVVDSDDSKTIYLDLVAGGDGEENPPPGTTEYTLTVEAYDDSNNLPMSGVHVGINGEQLTTNSEGRVSATVTAGQYEITLAKTGYVSENMTITISTSNKVISFYMVKSTGGATDGTGGGSTMNKTPAFEAVTLLVALGISFSLLVWRKRRKE